MLTITLSIILFESHAIFSVGQSNRYLDQQISNFTYILPILPNNGLNIEKISHTTGGRIESRCLMYSA